MFIGKFLPKIDRKLTETQVKQIQKTSLKLFPSTPKLQINQPDGWSSSWDQYHYLYHLAGLFAILAYSGCREVFGTFLTCFSDSFRLISGTNFWVKLAKKYV